MKDGLSHLDAEGRAHMVNVGAKPVTHRVCVVSGEVRMAPATLEAIADGTVPKGDVLATARLAGIQAAKRTDQWIPLAHPLPLDAVEIELVPERAAAGESDARVRIEARAEAHWRTGVEMEAFVAASAAGLTIYDMCKAIDRGMTVGGFQLEHKSGGKSGPWTRSDG